MSRVGSLLSLGFLTIFPPGSSWSKPEGKQAVAPVCGVLEWKPPSLAGSRPVRPPLSPGPRHQWQPPCPSTSREPRAQTCQRLSSSKTCFAELQTAPRYLLLSHCFDMQISSKKERKKERGKTRKIPFGGLRHSTET